VLPIGKGNRKRKEKEKKEGAGGFWDDGFGLDGN